MDLLDVFVGVLSDTNEDGWDWMYVTTIPAKTDMGEVVAACQVLFPTMIGFSMAPPLKDEADE